jgi:glucose-fructose oxidoreductase
MAKHSISPDQRPRATLKLPQEERAGRSSGKKIRYAVVGLGDIAQKAVLPAFTHVENAELKALVSGDPLKREALGRKYKVRSYGYEQFEDFLGSGEVDAVYIALPDSLHCEYTVRAANAGIHVLCEKPMAETEAECDQMIQAAHMNNIKLMIAYRLHFEGANLEAIGIAQSGQLGELRIFESVNTQNVEAGNIRLQRKTGRGPLYDVGVYCINAARYIFRAEPTEAFCFHLSRPDDRFREVPEMSTAVLRFPGDRAASFTCSYGAARVNSYRVIGTKGDLRLDPAFDYAGELKRYLTIDGNTEERTFPKRDQFASELIYFADCILQDQDPEPSGVEGLADVRVVEALYRAAAEQRPVEILPLHRSRYAVPEQEIEIPPIPNQDLIHAKSPNGEK